MRRLPVAGLPGWPRQWRCASAGGRCACTRRPPNCVRSVPASTWHNGLRALELIGALDEVVANSTRPPIYETRVQNRTVSREKLPGMLFRVMTRQHLHSAILAAARREGVDIVVDSEVVSADPAGAVTLASGQVLRADLVVGADGVGSAVRDSSGSRRIGRPRAMALPGCWCPG